jgi:hypothetical protein
VARFGQLLSKDSVFVIHDWEDETFEPGFERALDDMVRDPFWFCGPWGVVLRLTAPVSTCQDASYTGQHRERCTSETRAQTPLNAHLSCAPWR